MPHRDRAPAWETEEPDGCSKFKRPIDRMRAALIAPATLLCLRGIVTKTTISYLEQRYIVLEKEIANALHQSPTDDLAIADLKYRKLIIADEIQHNRRLVERFGKLAASSH
jgi:hypothetical protein